MMAAAAKSPQTAWVPYYPFNDNANDESGNGHNGEIIGNVTLSEDRKGDANLVLIVFMGSHTTISQYLTMKIYLSTFAT